MKVFGVILVIAGGISAVAGYTQMNSWQYQLSNAIGFADSTPSLLLYGGIAAVVLGILLLFSGGKTQSGA